MRRKLAVAASAFSLVSTLFLALPAYADEFDNDAGVDFASTATDVSVSTESADSTSTDTPLPSADKQPAADLTAPTGSTSDTDVTTSSDTTTPARQDVEQVDIYRVYNPRSGEHLSTRSKTEYSLLVERGWYDEGTPWRSPATGDSPVYRFYNTSNGAHIYSLNAYEISLLEAQGWKNEGILCYNDNEETTPVYRLRQATGNAVSYQLVVSETEKDALVAAGWKNEGVAFHASSLGDKKAWPQGAPARVTDTKIYRLYNIISGEHLYTKDVHEVSVLTQKCWVNEGIGWVAPSWSQIPVYRVYNPASGEHHYTLDTHEVEVLATKHGWKNEGIAWYSSQAKEVPIYRQYNQFLRIGQHHYTADRHEYDVLARDHGWVKEGVGWYALGGGQPYSASSSAAAAQCAIASVQDAAARDMTRLAQNYSSSTEWLILINNSTARVGIFHKEHGSWWLKHYWAAGPGADRSPTVKGEFTVGNRGYVFGKGYSCYYWVQFYGDYLFHSILYNQGTFQVQDGRLGMRVSHGC
ncbi:MAG: hypothetical protein IKZ87_05570, partial [Actinomycetaceae bacterium]|nr:hypothetical protein [Actinomycetaceae bacterium]